MSHLFKSSLTFLVPLVIEDFEDRSATAPFSSDRLDSFAVVPALKTEDVVWCSTRFEAYISVIALISSRRISDCFESGSSVL
jgi:hypothetical protein